MDVTQFPRYQDAGKENNGKTHTEGQCPGHVAAFGFAAIGAATLHHKKQGGGQTANNADKCQRDQVFHRADYPVNSPVRSPRFWLVTCAALAGVVLTASLGRWQLGRASEKLALQSQLDSRRALPVLGEQALLRTVANPDALLQRRIVLQGHWLPQYTVFLDNRQMSGQPGFLVLTPLRLVSADTTVLVQRGWLQRNFLDRTQLPAVPTPTGQVTLAGRIAPAPSKLYEFAGADAGVIRQNLDMVAFAAEIGQPLVSVTVLQADDPGGPGDGLLRNWPAPVAGVDKHYGYAFQWFGLAALIAVLYVWFQLVRRFYPAR